METQFTIRLPADLSSKIKEKARRLKLKRTDIIRLAVADFVEGPDEGVRPYERVKHLIGSIRTGVPDLGSRHREYLIGKFRDRRG